MLQGLTSQADIRTRARLGQGLGGIPRNPSQAIPDENIVFPDRILSGKLVRAETSRQLIFRTRYANFHHDQGCSCMFQLTCPEAS
jgi:hypothetical protein